MEPLTETVMFLSFPAVFSHFHNYVNTVYVFFFCLNKAALLLCSSSSFDLLLCFPHLTPPNYSLTIRSRWVCRCLRDEVPQPLRDRTDPGKGAITFPPRRGAPMNYSREAGLGGRNQPGGRRADPGAAGNPEVEKEGEIKWQRRKRQGGDGGGG